MLRAIAVLLLLAVLTAPLSAQETAISEPIEVSLIAPVPPPRPGSPAALAAAIPHLVITDDDREVIRRISEYHSGIDTMVGRFLQIDEAGGRLEGVFYLDRPNRIRFRYAPPSFDEIISTGRGFYVVNRKERTRSVYPQDQVPLRQFLTDRIDLLSANITDIVRTEEMIAISLADDTPIGKVEVTLIFELATSDLRQWSLTEPNGGELVFTVYDTLTGITIPPRYFDIDPNLLDTNPDN